MIELRLDHFVIGASDTERSNAFYARVFGADVLTGLDLVGPEDRKTLTPAEFETAKGFSAYRFVNGQINVHGPGVTIDASLLARLPVRPGNSDFCFEWPGPIADAIAHLLACDVPIEVGPRPTGGRKGPGTSVYFRDPDGALLEFISYQSRPSALSLTGAG